MTTPQLGSSDVAVRAGTLAEQTHQKVLGVVENMSSFPCPHCGEPLDLFGVGGGDLVAEQLTSTLGTEVPVLGKIPFDPRLREGGDSGHPLVISEPQAPASIALTDIAATLLGCVQPIFESPLAKPASHMYWGIWVVLPDPVSPTMTTTW